MADQLTDDQISEFKDGDDRRLNTELSSYTEEELIAITQLVSMSNPSFKTLLTAENFVSAELHTKLDDIPTAMENKTIRTARMTVSQARCSAKKYESKRRARKAAGSSERPINKITTPHPPPDEQTIILQEKGKNMMVNPWSIDLTVDDQVPLPKRAKTSRPMVDLTYPNDMSFRQSKENCLLLLKKSISSADAFQNLPSTTLIEDAAFMAFKAAQNMVIVTRKHYEAKKENKRLTLKAATLEKSLDMVQGYYRLTLAAVKRRESELKDALKKSETLEVEKNDAVNKLEEMMSELERLKIELQTEKDVNADLCKHTAKASKMAKRNAEKLMAMGYHEAKKKHYDPEATWSSLSRSLSNEPFTLSDISSDMDEVIGPERLKDEESSEGNSC